MYLMKVIGLFLLVWIEMNPKEYLNSLAKEEILRTLTSLDGKDVSLFQILKELNQFIDMTRHSEVLNSLSTNDIFEYAEKEKLITIHRENS